MKVFKEQGQAIRRLKDISQRVLESVFSQVYGPFFSQPLCPDKVETVFFVCRGNVCRSPFAEYLFNYLAALRSIKSVAAYSAGLEVGVSNPPPAEACVAARHFGISLDGHRSKQLTPEMIKDADVVFVMEWAQWNTLRKLYPEDKDKIFLLPAFENCRHRLFHRNRLLNIQDPYGKNIEDFLACFKRIESCIKSFFNRIGNDV